MARILRLVLVIPCQVRPQGPAAVREVRLPRLLRRPAPRLAWRLEANVRLPWRASAGRWWLPGTRSLRRPDGPVLDDDLPPRGDILRACRVDRSQGKGGTVPE